MSELGQLLKNARLEKGYTLEDIQGITKIRKHYLEAIEDGNFKALPGNFYVKAFIKTYAETVGLNPDDVLGLYKNVLPAAPQETRPEPVARKRRRSDSDTEKVGKWASSALMWLFPILIIGIIYFAIVNKQDGNEQQSKPQDDTKITDETKEPEVVPNEGSTNGDSATGTGNNGSGNTPAGSVDGNGTGTSGGDTGTTDGTVVPNTDGTAEEPALPQDAQVVFDKKSGKTDNFNVSGSTSITVELTVAEGKQCWYEVREGNSKGKQLDTGTLENSSTVTVTSDKDTFIKVGNAANVVVKVNGVQVEDGDQPNSKRLQMNLSAM
ncbi:helix-turn-helix domain-containing protein [Paenibacillus gansuensis]|uniref:Helix-turn-helix domain-containing protein n=1 Tax=Paenibacillus gansuensis TaxID=306542 RepID=A0ABW5PFD1_9BACL